MANRLYTAVLFTLEKNVVSLFSKVTFGAMGAPTISKTTSKGIVSVTRNGTGLFTFVFGTASTVNQLDTYNKLLAIHHVFDTSSPAAAPAAPAMYINSNQIATNGTASIQVQFNLAGVATDPASGEILYINFLVSNSSAV